MLRYAQRVTSWSLDGAWKAAVVRDNDRFQAVSADFDDSSWASVNVPHHWANDDLLDTDDGPVTYRRKISLPPLEAQNRRWIEFDGIFYQADIWLDGAYIADPEGYFAPHAYDVSALWRLSDEHQLAVEVHAPTQHAGPRSAITGVLQDPDGPRVPNPGGIWRSVRVVDSGPVRIESLRVLCQDANPDRAHLRLHARLDSTIARTAIARTTVDDEVVSEHTVALAGGTNEVSWRIDLPQPQLWWPHDLGSPHLVNVSVSIIVDGAMSDARSRRTGLREVAWNDWVCSVNGERLFLKGANLMPIENALGNARDEQVQHLIGTAVDSGLDVLRVHGHIAPPLVYDLADELGLLLMQDFPLQGVYRRTIRQAASRQATEMVDLLGHHPSIILWSAHDEPVNRPADGSLRRETPAGIPERMRDLVARAKRLARDQTPTWNRSILDPLVRRSIESADSTRRCSPHSGVLPNLPLLDGSDSHLYIGWTDGPIADLPLESARFPRLFRFVSEFGAPAAPRSAECTRNLDSGTWPEVEWDIYGAQTGVPIHLYDDSTPPTLFTNLTEWIDATEAHQATVIGRWVEHLRRIAYQPTGGFCVRSWNDHCANSGWGVIDSLGQPRPALQALQAACAPIIIAADRLPYRIDVGAPIRVAVHIASDLRSDVEDALIDIKLTAPHLDEHRQFGGVIEANSTTFIGEVECVVSEYGQLEIDIDLTVDDEVIARYHDSTHVG